MQKLTTKQSHTDQREEDKQNGPKRSHTRRAPTTTARTLCLRNQQVQPGPMIEPKPETRKRNRLSCDQKDTFSERIWRMPFIQLTYSLTHSPTIYLSIYLLSKRCIIYSQFHTVCEKVNSHSLSLKDTLSKVPKIWDDTILPKIGKEAIL